MQVLAIVFVRVALTMALIVGGTWALGPAFSVSLPSAVLADDDDSDDDEDDGDTDDEHEASGQVIEVYPDKVPPEFVIANVDGKMTVKVIKVERYTESGVKLGDHVSVDGEKLSEQLFEATEIEITRRCCPGPNDND